MRGLGTAMEILHRHCQRRFAREIRIDKSGTGYVFSIRAIAVGCAFPKHLSVRCEISARRTIEVDGGSL